MIQDRGPQTNIGFGLPLVRGEKSSNAPEQGPNPENGPVARFLGDKPIAKFAITAVASVLSLSVAGKVARSGGYRLGEEAAKIARGNSWLGEQIKAGGVHVRKAQSYLDELEGVTRVRVDPANSHVFAKRDAQGGWIKDDIHRSDDALRRANNSDLDPWQARDEIQQRLVRQARRLPYELPGFYVADKVILDPLLDNDQRRQVNWSNPIDVMGDFAWESVKNTTLGILPFEAVVGSGAQTFRRFQHAFNAPGGGQENNIGILTTKAILEKVGAKSGDLINQSLKFSNQSLGAFTRAVEEASQQRVSSSALARNAFNILSNDKSVNRGRYAFDKHKRMAARANNPEYTNSVFDAMPGPFRGMATGARQFKKSFKEIGETYDDHQAVLSGRKRLNKLDLDPDKAKLKKANVLHFMDKNGSSYLEQVAKQMDDLGIRGVRGSGNVSANVANRGRSSLETELRQNSFKDSMIRNMEDIMGMSSRDAEKFVSHASNIKLPNKDTKSPLFNLSNRLQFGKKSLHKKNDADWWSEVSKSASDQNIDMKGSSLDSFKQVMALADHSYTSKSQELLLKAKIKSTKESISEFIPDNIGGKIGSKKADYYDLKNSLGSNDNFLVKNTALSLGIKTVANDGSDRTLASIRRDIAAKGINAKENNDLLEYLARNGKVKKPWERRGDTNIFGFSSLTLNEALSGSYYASANKGTRQQLRNIAERRGSKNVGVATAADRQGISSAQSALKLPGVYRSASGNVIDFGRVSRGLMGALDAVAAETKIPILNFNPLQIGFYQSFRAARSASPIQFAGKYSAQNVAQRTGSNKLGGVDNADLYMYLRKGNRAKGSLFGFKHSRMGEMTQAAKFQGEYTPFLTNRDSMTGLYSELYTGRSATPGSKSQTNKYKRLFDVATEQESNIFAGKDSLLGRVNQARRGQPQAVRNPRRAARSFSSKNFKVDDLTEDQSFGFEQMFSEAAGFGYTRKIMNRFSDIRLTGKTDLPDPHTMTPKDIGRFLDDDLAKPLTEDQSKFLSQAQGRLKKQFDQAGEQSDFWKMPAPQSVRTVGVSTRLDQARSEFSNYLFLRDEAFNGTEQSFAVKISGMIGEVEKMFTKGALTRTEKSEARAAILSLQLQYSKVKTFTNGVGQNRFQSNQATLADALAGPTKGSSQVRELFEDFGTYGTEDGIGPNFLRAGFKKKFAPADYQGPDKLSPMGSNYLFMPTVGTSFKAGPIKTAKGVLGFSWGDPDSVSVGSLPATHLAARTNKFFESVGLGLDPTNYKGPMDFFARGLVGKRVLPAYAAGSTFVALDRTAGGMVNRDEEGNRVYKPLLIGAAARGVAEGQIAVSGLTPGGQSASEKRAEIFEGEVPVRQGRYWLLNSNTPFKGGRVQYFRPSWYQRLNAAGEYSPEMKQTPLEKLAFGYDFSPLRPLDPYRMERQSAKTRPYPVSGDYFTGPFGPVTSALNATIGRVLKPSIRMNEEATAMSLASFSPMGQNAAVSVTQIQQKQGSMAASYSAIAGGPAISSSQPFNASQGYTAPRGIASASTRRSSSNIARGYEESAVTGNRADLFSPMLEAGMGGSGISYGGPVVRSTAVQRGSQNNLRAGRLGFEAQEMAGIYGFAAGTFRSGLGIGSQDFTPNSAVLDKASRGYSSSRSFWGLNLGGLGDAPLPIEGRFANLEFSEVLRRFMPQEQQGINYINGIPNEIGQKYPWLPGPGSLNNLREGDPYRDPDNTIRLPGTARNRIQKRYPDAPGQEYGITDIHDMLGDLDPFGDNYRSINRQIDSQSLSAMQKAKIAQTRAQVSAVGIKNEFSPYKHRYSQDEDLGETKTQFSLNKGFEYLAHRDNFFNNKFLRVRTAQEDWERSNVYGATYPSWGSPKDSFIDPMVQRATQRDPVSSVGSLSAIGSMFGSSARAKTAGALVGATTGMAASAYGHGYEAITGNRYIPKTRKKELMLEEQVDILSYMHSMVNASRSVNAGDQAAAQYFLQESTKTMYGANLNATPEQLTAAMPKRKREHFKAMMYAPEEERGEILETAGRLERRMLQAAWGQKVERLPDVQEFFESRELPNADSGFWSPYTDMDSIKIKMGQSLGLDMSQMGFFPQQIGEANMINPEYPSVFANSSSKSVTTQLSSLLNNMGVQATIEQRPSIFSSGDQFQLVSGV